MNGFKLPVEPLIRAAHAESLTQFAEMLHVNYRDVARAVQEGLGTKRADRWAVKLGLHPYEVWPIEEFSLAAEVEHVRHWYAGHLKVRSPASRG